MNRLIEGVTVKPITPEIATLAAQFPDPADRIIGATARAEGIRKSSLLKTIWYGLVCNVGASVPLVRQRP